MFNVNDYPCPAGGCLLTNEGYANKVRDLIKHDELILDNITILKMGRHFRISPCSKLIVGRDEKENQRLLDIAQEGDTVFEPIEEIKGPVALGKGGFADEQIELSGRIIGRYCDEGYKDLQIITRKLSVDSRKVITCLPFTDSDLSPFRI